MKRILLLLSIILCSLFNAEGKNILLTLSGTDTILTNYEYGFDFINQQACTTLTYEPSYNCYNHFCFVFYPRIGQFDLAVDGGYGIQCGKINLDSIHTAPPDSTFKLSLHIDSIPQDSLSSYVGNSYIIKTGVDPRYSDIYFAKIRILGFRVINSATQTIEMRFLWACNVNSSRDIATSGLDTFNFSTVTIPFSAKQKSITISSGQSVFKVVGDRLVVPKEIRCSAAYCSIYNLNGKMLGRMPITNNSIIDLQGIRRVAKGVLVVKVEK